MGRVQMSTLAVLCLGTCLGAAPRPAVAEELTPRAIYRQTVRATAWVAYPKGKANGPQTLNVGTAWVVDRSRKLLISCYHVVGDRDEVFLLFPEFRGGRVIAERDHYVARIQRAEYTLGKVVDVDPKRDLALIEVTALPENAVELKPSASAPEPGDRVHAVGNPEQSKALWGYVAGSVRQVYHVKELVAGVGLMVHLDAQIVETQLPLTQGDSGGPVVDDAGRVVGVSGGYKRNAPSVTSCVAVSEVEAFLREAEAFRAPRTAADFNRRGLRHYQHGRWQRAVADFTAALRLDPKQAAFYINRATARQRQGAPDEAIADYDKALQLDPQNATVHNDRGVAQLARGKFAEAITDCSEAIRLNPRYALAFNNRGVTHFKKGDLARAVADYTEALRLDPRYALAFDNRGFAHFKQGEHGRAIADFNEAIRLAPSLPGFYYNRGLAHFARGDHARAIADFSEAIRLQPLFTDAYSERGRAYAAMDDAARARADFEKAAQLDPNRAKKK
jgi:tetratricopeptide (TPR) repeat protein